MNIRIYLVVDPECSMVCPVVTDPAASFMEGVVELKGVTNVASLLVPVVTAVCSNS
jgi:hypothetical protein